AELGRNSYVHGHVQITPAVAVQPGHALAAHDDHAVRLRAGGDVGADHAVVRHGDLDLAAQRGLRERDRRASSEIRPLAFEALVRFDLDVYVQVARGQSVRPRHALAGHAQALARVDPARDRHDHFALALHRARAVAGFAGIGQVLPGAPATRARAGKHDEAALCGHLTRAPTLAAGLGLAARLRPDAVAGVTRGRAADVDLVLAAEQRFAQRNHGFDPHVLAALGAFATASALLTTKTPEEIGEHVLEVAQDVAHVAAAAARAIQPRVAIAIIHLALLGIREHAVRLARLLELFFSGLVPRIAVGMVLQGSLAIGFFDFVVRGLSRDAQDHVIVTLFTHAGCCRAGHWKMVGKVRLSIGLSTRFFARQGAFGG